MVFGVAYPFILRSEQIVRKIFFIFPTIFQNVSITRYKVCLLLKYFIVDVLTKVAYTYTV
jgi:hypothetical protein